MPHYTGMPHHTGSQNTTLRPWTASLASVSAQFAFIINFRSGELASSIAGRIPRCSLFQERVGLYAHSWESALRAALHGFGADKFSAATTS